LSAQNYSWTMACKDQKGNSRTYNGNFTVAACQNTSQCGIDPLQNAYCTQAGTCAPADPWDPASPSLYVTSSAPGTSYQVGQGPSIVAGLAFASAQTQSQTQLSVLIDGQPMAAGTTFTSAQIGNHSLVVAAAVKGVTDIQGNPVLVAHSSAIPITVT